MSSFMRPSVDFCRRSTCCMSGIIIEGRPDDGKPSASVKGTKNGSDEKRLSGPP